MFVSTNFQLFQKKISRPCLFASSFPLLQEREAAQTDSFSAGDSPAPFLSGGAAGCRWRVK
jgi:hypothetical protein